MEQFTRLQYEIVQTASIYAMAQIDETTYILSIAIESTKAGVKQDILDVAITAIRAAKFFK